MDTFSQARAQFDRHVASFRDADGSLPFALEAKFNHTGEVCEITEKIVAGEARFSPHDMLIFRLCALFHDISRFEQYDKFRTFLDRQSFDHGDRSAALIDELGLVPDLPAEVMGVRKDYHRHGIGKKLVARAKEIAREAGYSFMQVKTVQLGKYEDYDKTNHFYIACGFKEFEVFPLLWDEDNPCQVYVMSL